jgi:3-oxoacyl-[acyl-carrier protein] reductase
MSQIPGQTVSLITGASRGIGKATAHSLASLGHSLVLIGRSKPALEQTENLCQEVAQTQNQQFISIACDFSEPNSFGEIFAALRGEFSGLDNMIHCAGHMYEASLLTTALEDLDSLYQIHLRALVGLCQGAAKLMIRKRGGSIVLVGSKVGISGGVGLSAYSAIKASLSGLTYSLSRELGPLGIRVNAVAPGFIETDLTSRYSVADRARFKEQINLRRLGTPEEVGEVIAFLCSKGSRYVTGQVIAVDGGSTL